MRLVIVGYGRVGIRTARILDNEGHEIVVVDNDTEKVTRARDAGFPVIEGDGSKSGVLEAADLEDADALGGLTGDPNVNYEACAIGKEHDCRVALRIDEDYEEETYQYYAGAVDEIVYPERVGAAGAKTALLGGDFNVLGELTAGLSAMSIRVPDSSPVIGERVVELEFPGETRVYAHGREGEPMTIPLPRTTVEAGDEFAVIADPNAVGAVRERVRGEEAT